MKRYKSFFEYSGMYVIYCSKNGFVDLFGKFTKNRVEAKFFDCDKKAADFCRQHRIDLSSVEIIKY